MEQANARVAGLTREQYWAMTALEEEIRAKLEAAVRAGADPAGEAGLDEMAGRACRFLKELTA